MVDESVRLVTEQPVWETGDNDKYGCSFYHCTIRKDNSRNHRMVKGGICEDCFRVGPIDTICDHCSRKENGFEQNSYLSCRTTNGEINPLQPSLAAETAIDMPKYWELKTWHFNSAENQCRNMNLEGK